jgi:hypothetical protein
MGLTSIFVTSLVPSPQGRRAAHDSSVRAQELAHAAAVKGRLLNPDGKVKVTDLSSKGKQTTVDLLAQAKDTASHVSGTAAENTRQLPQIGAPTINETRGIMNSALGDAKGYINTVPSNKSTRIPMGADLSLVEQLIRCPTYWTALVKLRDRWCRELTSASSPALITCRILYRPCLPRSAVRSQI